MKKHIILLLIVFTVMTTLSACNNPITTNPNSENTSTTVENSGFENTPSEVIAEEPHTNNTVEFTPPPKSEVLAMREIVLNGMVEDDIDKLCILIKNANHAIESAVIYQNLFGRLSATDDLYWNYFDKSGNIQIGWAYDGDLSIQDVMTVENLTEEEFYEKYGSEVMTYHEYSADFFVQELGKIKDTVSHEGLRCDLQQLMNEVQLAAETHDVAHVENLYHILHDMDYYLLNYRLDTEKVFIQDTSTISQYYGVLSVYEK